MCQAKKHLGERHEVIELPQIEPRTKKQRRERSFYLVVVDVPLKIVAAEFRRQSQKPHGIVRERTRRTVRIKIVERIPRMEIYVAVAASHFIPGQQLSRGFRILRGSIRRKRCQSRTCRKRPRTS